MNHKGVAILVDDRLQPDDPNFGRPVTCYVCAAPHEVSGIVYIVDNRGVTKAAVCDVCLPITACIMLQGGSSMKRKARRSVTAVG